MKLSNYRLAMLLIAVFLCMLPLIILAVVEVRQILPFSHDWLLLIAVLMSSWHFIARAIIRRCDTLSTLAKAKGLCTAITLCSLSQLLPVLGICWLVSLSVPVDEPFSIKNLYIKMVNFSLFLNMLWCVSYYIALRNRQKYALEQTYQQLSMKMLRDQLQPSFL